MSLETLLKERNELRDEIETRRKQNESVLLSIKGFLARAKEYIMLCDKNGINAVCSYMADDAEYIIKCNSIQFEIKKLDKSRKVERYYISFESQKSDFCCVGNEPSLKTITGTDGVLTPDAVWFRDNMEGVIASLDSALEECVRSQIKEAKKLLGREVPEAEER